MLTLLFWRGHLNDQKKNSKKKLTGTERMQHVGRDLDKPLFQKNLHFTADSNSSHFSTSKKGSFLPHVFIKHDLRTGQEMNTICFVYHRPGNTLGMFVYLLIYLLSSYYVPRVRSKELETVPGGKGVGRPAIAPAHFLLTGLPTRGPGRQQTFTSNLPSPPSGQILDNTSIAVDYAVH